MDDWTGGDQAPTTASFLNPEPFNPRHLRSYEIFTITGSVSAGGRSPLSRSPHCVAAGRSQPLRFRLVHAVR